MAPNRSRLAVTVGAFAAALATVATGTPGRLPDIALTSSLLFHLERGLALVAGYLAVLVVISRGWNGQLPIELSARGLRYASEVTAKNLEAIEEEMSRAADERERL